MLEQALKNLFTIHGLITTFLQITILAGSISLYVGFNILVLGKNPAPSMTSHR